MSRFFKSAAFPILIVVVLAFLAVKLVNPGSGEHRSHSYQTLVSKELPQGEVKSVEFKNKGKALEVKYKDKEQAEFGYIDYAAPQLISQLEKEGVRFNIESEKSSAQTSSVRGLREPRLRIRYWSVSPESTMSSTISTSRPSITASRSFRIRTTPEDFVAEP